MRNKIFCVVVNYNGRKVIEKCLRSLLASEEVNLSLVVVDNASQDGSMGIVRSLFPRARCIINSENRGFSAGVNIGTQYALRHGAEYIFLLNNDATVEKDTIFTLFRYAESEKNKKNIFSPCIVSSFESPDVWFCGGRINWIRMRTTHISVRCILKKPFLSEYLTGCSLFIPRSAFDDIGFFDERFFLYYEDADWSLRARNLGYNLWIVPSARVAHEEQSEKHNSFKTYFLVLSGVLFFRKNASGVRKTWCSTYLFFRLAKNIIQRIFGFGDKYRVESVYNAYKDAYNDEPLRYYRTLRER